ncbi:MAG: HDOD domain-containing protein [Acidobacteria bacterium]|nr:MAG: HDOD domain-containing protein [Acidobacteriota bacterium]
MKRILFVDDEPNVLAGLKRMLRSLRREYEMEFVGSGKEALAAMERQPADVVVADMKMPGMDGAELLEEIRRRWPDTIRLILSGHAESEAILRSIGPTHQFLAKPCDPETLRRTIRRAYATRELLENPQLKAIVSQVESLPSVPSLFQEVVEELQRPTASLRRVGELIARDVGMSAKILQIVNSAYFGLVQPIHNVERAVAFLGVETITSLVLGAHVFSQFEGNPVPGFSADALMHHSLHTAALGRRLAELECLNKQSADDVFLCGILHDAGKLVLAANLPDKYAEAIEAARDDAISETEAERSVIGGTHAEIGAYLLGVWGLPDIVVEAVAYHHDPGRCPDPSMTLTLLHAANALAHGDREADSFVDTDFLSARGLADRWKEWREAATSPVGSGV